MPSKAQESNMTLAAKAYSEILRRITVGEFHPRERLTEGSLCEMLDMGRTPIRQSLHRLTAEGLLVAEPYHAVHVRELSEQDVVDLYIVREAMEAQAARYAAQRITDAELRELYDLCDQMDAIAESDVKAKLYRQRVLDVTFHHRFVELSGVKGLTDFYRRHHLLQIQIFGWHASRFSQNVQFFEGPDLALHGQMHRPIVDGLATRDPQKAEDAVRQTVTGAIRRFREGMAYWKTLKEIPLPASMMGSNTQGSAQGGG